MPAADDDGVEVDGATFELGVDGAAPRRRFSSSFMPAATMENPLSTYVISPVMPLERSDSRNAATLPTSSAVTLRRSGAFFSTKRWIFEKPPMPAAASVLIGPAEMPLTRMPSGPRQDAR